jgi:pimeloyl-ACP methyl ester carboxylesterase
LHGLVRLLLETPSIKVEAGRIPAREEGQSMINQYGFEIGVMGGRHPFVRVGKHRPPLVVLPGLTLDYRPPSWWVMSSDAPGFHRLSTARTVYVVQRRRGLRPDTTLRDLADEYGALIRQEWGRVDLMGLSCGGAIAQHIALNHPESVESLVLVMSGAKLGAAGRDLGLRWLGLAQTGQWAVLREELFRSALDGHTPQGFAPAYRVLAGEGGPDPVDAQDFVTVLSSLLTQDTSLQLPGLSLRTLVVGGGEDRFYPEAALRDLAGAIPRSTLIIRPEGQAESGRRQARELQDDVLDFLRGRTPVPELIQVDVP